MNDTYLGNWEDAVRWLREQPDQRHIVLDAYFDDPLISAADRYWRSNEWAAVRKLIGKGPGWALDAGAGRGIASYALAKDGFLVTALEPDQSNLVGSGAIRALAKETNLSIIVEENLSETLPFENNSFDVIFARAVLHHIADLPAAMREFHRVLKPGGVFVAAREHIISNEGDLPAFFEIHPLHRRYGGENAHPVYVYQDAIRQSGLRLDRTIGSLDSPINFGPQSTADVNRRIVKQLIPVPLARPFFEGALSLPIIGVWIRYAASRIDKRPGRHASFVARKPL